MGTNYYWKLPQATLVTGEAVPIDRNSPKIHIGKISGAGRYCTKCKITLCKGDPAQIHHGRDFYWCCPTCGSAPNDSLTDAITYALAMSWAQEPATVRKILYEHLNDEIVVDELDRHMTGQEFLAEVNACQFEFLDSVGTAFS